MQYFEVISAGIFLVVALIWFWIFNRRLRRDYYGKMLTRAVLKHQQQFYGEAGFSTPAIRKSLTVLLCNFGRRRQMLEQMMQGDFESWQKYLSHQPQDNFVKTWIAMLEGRQLPVLMNKGQYAKAKISLAKAEEALSEGDLLTASEQASWAVKMFHRDGAYYEEAQAHLLLGTIYRVSAVCDVAQTMLDAAGKIFHELGAVNEEATAMAYLGMLMTAEERVEEAQDYFGEAMDLYQQIGNETGQADIQNQQALMMLICQQFPEAYHLAEAAAKVHQQSEKLGRQALSLEIMARASAAQSLWQESATQAEIALNLYFSEKNAAGIQEARFLWAQAEAEQGHFPEAEKLLRQIIAEGQSHPCCFHLANAYHLLGAIFLKQGDLGRAKGLFQQSLDCELANNRSDGIAIDYANLALIDFRRGDQKQAEKTLQTAIDFAKAYGETGLSLSLEEKLTEIQNKP